jgi:L-fucose isomerase-like protein
MLGNRSQRFLAVEPAEFLSRPLARIQPILATRGRPTIDTKVLAGRIAGYGVLNEVIPVESPEHWGRVVRGIAPEVDAILPLSIPAYPTEVWNSHPQPLVDRKLPLIFWPLIEYDEPDFWRWSARDLLRALGVQARIVRNEKEGIALLAALAMKRMLASSRIVVFGEQNFPWNANAAGHLMTESLGTRILVRPLSDIRERAAAVSEPDIDELWESRKGRYVVKSVRDGELRQALRTTIAIRAILREERALGFGVNCFGDLVIGGGRDVPCLAQALLREEGYVASCDGDFCAMLSMALVSFFLDAPCMMSNMYPVSYVGALTDHFGAPLSPDPKTHPKGKWKRLARIAHCGFIGVVSPEMTPTGKTVLKDWGGTYEIKRDGRGCGLDGDLRAGQRMTVVELRFDGKTLLLAGGKVLETTRHRGMPHCESSALLEFDDLEGFVDNISREHTVILYGDRRDELRVLGDVLGLTCMSF